MCGIAALLSDQIILDNPNYNFDAMNSFIQPRGPDGVEEWNNNKNILFHSRLSILDLDARSSQPFHCNDLVIVYNGEIFNFLDLKRQLQLEGVPFSTSGDTEVLIKAIEAWGIEKALEKAAGMFSFVLYNKKTGQSWAVRDRLGIKPLYFTSGNNYLAFASWPSVLLKGLNRDWKLDHQGVHNYFQLGATFGGKTFIQGIEEVPPGEIWQIDRNLNIQKKGYWNVKSERRTFDYEEFESLFQEVVKQHLLSDVPIGLMLSGGVDSTALATQMDGAAAFHLCSSELEFATLAADHCNLKLHCHNVEDLTEWGKKTTTATAISGNTYSGIRQTLILSEAIKKSGLKVALSANGADELFLGYSRTPAPSLKRPLNYLKDFHEQLPAKSFKDQLDHMFVSPENLASKLTGKLSFKQRRESFIAAQQEQLDICNELVGPHAAHRLFELKTYVANDLNANLDNSSMLNGVEMRVPFLDHRLVEYALSLDVNSLINKKFGRKAPLKALLKRFNVPEKIWKRPKLGFTVSSSALATSRNVDLMNFKSLLDSQVIDFIPEGGNFGRDFRRILSMSSSFCAWKKAWLDTQIVKFG